MNRLDLLSAWFDAARAMHLDAGGLTRRRARLWRRLEPAVAATPALSRHAGSLLRDMPITDSGEMRNDISQWNSLGIPHDRALTAALDAETGGGGVISGDVIAGLSTGTSGRRGMFLASASERATQIGQSIARLLPLRTIITGARIALILRADSDLYRDVGTGRFAFLHMPLGLDAADMGGRLAAFRPTVLIAPPRELAMLAESGLGLPDTLQRIFWGGEPIAPVERAALARDLGLRPDPIYQATEGFIASSCRHGGLHLNDDSMEIELESVAGTDAFRPIVTDLMRTTQPMVRVRLDDLVRPSRTPCPCASARRTIEPVLGRVDDVWRIGETCITPETVDDHFAVRMPDHSAWRVEGSPDGVWATIVDEAHRHDMTDAITAIHPGVEATIQLAEAITGPKRRRITWRDRR